MALRSAESIRNEGINKTGIEKQFYIAAENIVSTYDEVYIRKEREKILENIRIYSVNKDKNKSEILRLKGKLKMFDFLLY